MGVNSLSLTRRPLEIIEQTGDTAPIDDFRIINKADNSHDLLIHESLLIHRDKPVLNSQQSSSSMVLF